jgi:ferric-dicitrate binding protein FerR (iron transport regulator)
MKKASLAFLFLCMAFSAYAQTGLIKELTGTVELMLPGATTFVAAKVGDRVSQDTVVSTGFRSYTSIEIGHSLITVRPLTRISLTAIQASMETELLNVNLQAGRVRVDVKPPAGTKASVEVQSSMSVASVRGTSFEFDTRNVYVSEGTVYFMGKRGQLVQVGAGTSSRVEADSRATSPLEIRTAGLLPPIPMGSDIVGVTNSGPAFSDVMFTIILEW